MKKTYNTPRLRVFGSVKNLTLGTGSTFGDSGPLSMATGGGGSMGGGGGGGGGSMGGSMTMSDINLKHNLTRIGTHPCGFGLYLFNYRPGISRSPETRCFGVIAQEVEHFVPNAVRRHPAGYRVVDYPSLGIYPAH